VRDQVSYPYSTTGKITVLYILIFIFLYETGRQKDFGLNDIKHSLNLIYWWDIITYFVFSAFIFRPTSLLASRSVSVLSFMVFIPSPNKLISSA
jgi:hypothetical protein